MMSLSDDPKITFALYKLEDLLVEQRQTPHPDFADIVSHKVSVLARYQPVFSCENVGGISREEFKSFLLIKNNHHWNNLHRVGKHIVEDMDLLREALTILLDETHPIQERLNTLRPERAWGTNSMVSHLGMPILTAILQIAHPDKYGVWNNTSDEGMKIVRLWKKDWETHPAGDCYVEMNTIYQHLATQLGIDLWTLDALWWVLKK